MEGVDRHTIHLRGAKNSIEHLESLSLVPQGNLSDLSSVILR